MPIANSRFVLATESRSERASRAMWEGVSAKPVQPDTLPLIHRVPVSLAFAASLCAATFVASYAMACANTFRLESSYRGNVYVSDSALSGEDCLSTIEGKRSRLLVNLHGSDDDPAWRELVPSRDVQFACVSE